jgi:hypothetical protein
MVWRRVKENLKLKIHEDLQIKNQISRNTLSQQLLLVCFEE